MQIPRNDPAALIRLAVTGCSSAWVEYLLRMQEVEGSNPFTLTLQFNSGRVFTNDSNLRYYGMNNLKESILLLRAEGKSYNDIKEALGCSKGTISYHLGPGQKEKTASRVKAQRESIKEFIRDLKDSTPCYDCGISYRYWIMDLDHLDPALKNFSVSKATSITRDLERVKAEVRKCDVVCGNCHRNRTHTRRLNNPQVLSDSSANQAQRKRRLKIYQVIQAKKMNPCVDCRMTYPHWVMDFDHLDPSLKEFSLGRFDTKTRNLEKVLAEIDKCDLVCHNCHRDRTFKREF